MTNKLALEAIDKLDLIKVDITFMSNLLISWNIDQFSPTYTDMQGMSRICDSVNEQLTECKDRLNSLIENEV